MSEKWWEQDAVVPQEAMASGGVATAAGQSDEKWWEQDQAIRADVGEKAVLAGIEEDKKRQAEQAKLHAAHQSIDQYGEAAHVANQIVTDTATVAERLIGMGDRADEVNREQDVVNQALSERDRAYWRADENPEGMSTLERAGQYIPFLKQGIRGAVRSFGSAVLGAKGAGAVAGAGKVGAGAATGAVRGIAARGVAGAAAGAAQGAGAAARGALATAGGSAYGAIGLASAQEANKAITEGTDAGLTGSALAGYVASQGVIEAAPAMLMQRLGMGGVEAMVAGPAIRGGVKAGFIEAIKAIGQEIPEELVTEVLHAVATEYSQVDPKALDSDRMSSMIADTVLQKVLMGAGAGAMQTAAGAAQAKLERLQAIRAKGFVSADDAKAEGIEGKNRKERLANADKQIEELKKQPPALPGQPPASPSPSPAGPTGGPPPLPGKPPAGNLPPAQSGTVPPSTPTADPASLEQTAPAAAPTQATQPAPTQQPTAQPSQPAWDVVQGSDGKLYRENPNAKTAAERGKTRQPVEPSEGAVLVTKDRFGKPIPPETFKARQEFADKAKPGAEFEHSDYKGQAFKVLDDGTLMNSSGRKMGDVQAMVNTIKPGAITWKETPSTAGPSEETGKTPTVSSTASPDAPAAPETSMGKTAGEKQSSEARADDTVLPKGAIGRNAKGEPVFEDENGVRSVGGVTEDVGMRPVRTPNGGITYQPEVDTANRKGQFKTTEETDLETNRTKAQELWDKHGKQFLEDTYKREGLNDTAADKKRRDELRSNIEGSITSRPKSVINVLSEYEPKPVEQPKPPAKLIDDDIERAIGNFKRSWGMKATATPADKLSTEQQEALDFATSRGQKLAFVDIAKSDKKAPIGSYHRDENVVLISNELQGDKLWGMVGNEMAHSTGLDKILPADSAELKQAMADYANLANEDVRKRLKTDKRRHEREGRAMMVQQFFESKSFRDQLKKSNPTMWDKLREAVLKFVGQWTPKDEAKRLVLEELRTAPKPEKSMGKKPQEDLSQDRKTSTPQPPAGYKPLAEFKPDVIETKSPDLEMQDNLEDIKLLKLKKGEAVGYRVYPKKGSKPGGYWQYGTVKYEPSGSHASIELADGTVESVGGSRLIRLEPTQASADQVNGDSDAESKVKPEEKTQKSEFDDGMLNALDAILQEEKPKPAAAQTSPVGDKTSPKAKSGQFALPGMPGMAAEIDRQDFVRKYRNQALETTWGWSSDPADAGDIQDAIDTMAPSVASLMNDIYAGKFKDIDEVNDSEAYAKVSDAAGETAMDATILNGLDKAIAQAMADRPKKSTGKKPPKSEQTLAEAKTDMQAALDAAADLLKDVRKSVKLLSVFDPELGAKTIRVAYMFTKAGVKTFKGYVEAIVEHFGEAVARELAPYMESGWRALNARGIVDDPAGKVEDYLTEVSDEIDTGSTRDGDGTAGARNEDLEESQTEAGGVNDTSGTPEANDGSGGELAGDGGRTKGEGTESSGGSERGDEDVRLDSGPGGNYRIGQDERVGSGAGRGFSPKTRFTENVRAIRLLKTLEKEGRKATRDEQSVLVKYVGWGGLKQSFGRGKLVGGKTVYEPIKGYESEFAELKDLLTDDEWNSAKKSITNAHYTDPAVIRGMWQGLQSLGFKGGKIVEPSSGTGLFFGLIPQSILDNPSTRLTATEIDSVSGRIAQQLYQDADVRVQGFEELNLADNSVDLFISNVPFGSNQLSDKKDRSIKKDAIHNFFFNKAIRKTRPGGLVAFITSRYSMDEKDASTREFWDKNGANLVGVVRLPGGAFKGIANTDVVTDIIILQKREDGEQPVHAAPWKKRKNVPQTGYLELVPRPDGKPGKIKVFNEGDTAFPVNEYFESHPEHVVGELAWTGTMQKTTENQVNVEPPKGPIGDRVTEIISELPVDKDGLDRTAAMTEEFDNADMEAIKAGDWKEDHLRVDGDRIYRNDDGNRVEVPTPYGRHKKDKDGNIVEIVPSKKGAERFTALIKVFDAAERLIALQPTNASDEQVDMARRELNKVYDEAVKEYGPLSSGWNATFAERSLTVASRLYSLEEYDPTTDTAHKAAIFRERTERPHSFPTKANNAKDALTISLSQKGRLDPEHVAGLLGKPIDSTMEELGDLVFRNHSGDWELAQTYLSGNVRLKLAEAKELANGNADYLRNVAALEAVQPKDLAPSQIEVRLNSPWIPTEVYEQFIDHLLRRSVKVSRSAAAGKWFVTPESRGRNDQLEKLDWGIERMPALDIISKHLNRGDLRVYDSDGNGGRVVNQDDTTQVAAKLTKIKAEFERWLWSDVDRADALTALYNREINNMHQEPRDGSHLAFPGMSEDVRNKLDKHQVNAVWRYLTGGNMLLAHVVGAGKSWIMTAAAMEQKRISGNPSFKTMIAVPNHLVTSGQFVKEILEAYPSAKVLAATPDSLSGIGRRSFLKKIATGNYDIVVIAHSSFGKIPLNPENEAQFIQKQIDDLEREIRTARQDSDRSYEAELQTMLDNLRDKLADISASLNRDELSTYFDDLNIDSLFVDEAHEFKNLSFRTRMSRVPGVNPNGSNMAFDMWMKTTYFNQATGEKKLMFATGTPIANAIAEMYTMQRYLQPSALARLGLEHFDSWAASFADEVTKPEIDPAGGGMRMHSRLSQYINMPELSAIFRQVADVQTADMLVDVLKRPLIEGDGPQAVKAERNAILEEIIEGLQERAQRVRSGVVDKSEDNMLNIVTDGRKAATDIRLIDPTYPDLKGSKINLAVENIHRIWKETTDNKSTQIVWLDVTSPNTDYPFNLYHEIVDKLAALGIPRDEIAIMHDYNEKTKAQLFRSMNKGDVRILLGSTPVMGTGVNVQEKLIASHHLDVPWRPDQLEQRDGRILRRGNTNKKVKIFRYISKGSFDAFMWDKIEQKTSFIRAAMSGASDRVLDASEAEDMSAAEMKAAAADDPNLIRYVTVQAEVNKLESEYRGFLDQQSQIRRGIAEARSNVERYTKYAGDFEALVQKHDSLDIPDGEVRGKVGDVEFTDPKEFATALTTALVNAPSTGRQGGSTVYLEYNGLTGAVFQPADSDPKDFEASGWFGDRYTNVDLYLGASPSGNITRLNNAIEKLKAQPKYYRDQAEINRLKGPALEKRIQSEWPDAKKLSDLRQEQSTLAGLVQASKGDEHKKAVAGQINQMTGRAVIISADTGRYLFKDVSLPDRGSRSNAAQDEAPAIVPANVVDAAEGYLTAERNREREARLRKLREEAEVYEWDRNISPRPVKKKATRKKAADSVGTSSLDAFTSPELQNRQSMGAARMPIASAADLVGDDDGGSSSSQFASPDKEFERRWQRATKGIGKKTLAMKLREFWQELVKSTVRGSLPELPRTEQFGEARSAMHAYQNAPTYAQLATADLLKKTSKPLSASDYDLFTRIVIMRDQVEAADKGERLSYGLSPSKAKAELARVEALAASNDRVQASLEYRKQWTEAMVDDFLSAHEYLGMDMADRFNRENYFRHQVLYYMEAQQRGLGKKKVELTPNRGWLKGRTSGDDLGEAFDINANYLQAEWEVSTQMIADTKRAQAIGRLKRHYDKMRQLKAQAKRNNYVAVVGGKENMDEIEDLRGKIAELRAAGSLDAGEKAQIKDWSERLWELDPTMPFRRDMAIARDHIERGADSSGEEVPDDFMRYVASLAKQEDSPLQPNALAFLKAVSDRKKFIKNALGDKYETWEDVIPDDHEEVAIRPGRAMFQAYSVPEQVASELMADLSKTLGISAEDLRPLTALGSKYTPLIVPQEVAAQMAAIDNTMDFGWLDRVVTKPMRAWKRWVLMSPTRVLKYNLRNLSEIDKVMSLNPAAMKDIPQAIRDLWKLYSGADDIPSTVRDWVERGGSGTLVRVNELGELNDLKQFARLLSDKKSGVIGKVINAPGNLWRTYWSASGISSDFRESILRYAAYLNYVKQLDAGKLTNYGGSVRAEVDGIKDKKDKAMRLSADLLGDYGDISIVGQFLRSRGAPFWSFQETNVRTYFRGLINLASNEQSAIKAGMAVARAAGIGGLAKTPFLAYKLGRIAILFYGLKAMTTAFNQLLFSDDDDELPEEEKKKAHLTFGKNSKGEVQYFSRIGTAADVLDWVGLDSVDYDLRDVLDGRRTIREVLNDMARSPVDKAYGMLSPFIKAPTELAVGQTAYPSVGKPRPIRDRGRYIAQTLGIQKEYDKLMGNPSTPYSVTDVLLYKVEPGTSAYYMTQDAKFRWLKEARNRGIGYSESVRGDALRNYKMALRLNDQAAVDKYLAEYEAAGGTKKGMLDSLESSHPAGGLSTIDAYLFYKSLAPVEQDEYRKAEMFYYSELLTEEQAKEIRTRRDKRLKDLAGGTNKDGTPKGQPKQQDGETVDKYRERFQEWKDAQKLAQEALQNFPKPSE